MKIRELLKVVYCFKCKEEFYLPILKNIFLFQRCPKCRSYFWTSASDWIYHITLFLMMLLLTIKFFLVFLYRK